MNQGTLPLESVFFFNIENFPILLAAQFKHANSCSPFNKSQSHGVPLLNCCYSDFQDGDNFMGRRALGFVALGQLSHCEDKTHLLIRSSGLLVALHQCKSEVGWSLSELDLSGLDL